MILLGFSLVADSQWARGQEAPRPAGSESTRRIPEALKFAHGLFRERKFDLAADEYERFLASGPRRQDADEARFGLANARLFQGRYQDALAAFQDFLEKAPEHPWARTARYRLGEVSYMLGDLRRARESLEAFVQGPRHPNLETAWTYLGDVCFALNDLPAARAAYDRSLTDFPNGQLANRSRFGLGRTLAGLGEHDSATMVLSALAKEGGRDWVDRARLQLGKVQLSRGQNEEALKSLEPLARATPGSSLKLESDLGRAEAYTRLSRFDEAAQLLEPLVSEGSDAVAPRAVLALSTLELQRNRLDVARKLLEQAITQFARSPLMPAFLFRLGEVLQKESRIDEARAAFLKLASTYPQDPWADDATARAATLALEAKDYPEALRLAASFVKQFPESTLTAEVRLVEARALAATGRSQEAIPLLEGLIRAEDGSEKPNKSQANSLTGPAAAAARYELALAYRAHGQPAKADALLAELAAEGKSPVGADALFVRGQNLVEQSQFGEAIEQLKQYLELNPKSELADFAVAHLVVAQLGIGSFEDAWTTTAELSARFPASKLLPATRLRLGEAALDRNQPGRAVEQFRLALTPVTPKGEAGSPTLDDSSRGRAMVGLGRALWKLGKPAEAATVFGQFLDAGSAGPLAPAVALDRAGALDAAGQVPEALKAYQAVSQQYSAAPEAVLAELASARMLARTGSGEQAADVFGKLLSNPNSEQLLRSARESRDGLLAERAWALADAGAISKADAVFHEILAKFPESRHATDARFHLAESANQAGQHEEVIKLLEPVVGLRSLEAMAAEGPPRLAVSPIAPLALYRLGRSQIALGHWEDAEKILERFVRDFPGHVRHREARYLVAEAALQQGQPERANSVLEILESDPPATSDPAGFMWLVKSRHVQSLLGLKKWKEALERAEVLRGQLPAKDPAIAELDFARGRSLLGLGRPDEARQALQAVIDARQGGDLAAQAHLVQGESYFHQERLREALREFLKVDILYESPQWQAAALLEAGKVYERLGQWSDAVETYERLRQKFPADPRAATVESRLAAARKQAQTAGAAGKVF